MAQITEQRPKPPAARFRGRAHENCTVHYVVKLTPAERGRGDIKPSTWCTWEDAKRALRDVHDYLDARSRTIGPDPKATVADICGMLLARKQSPVYRSGSTGQPLAASTITLNRQIIELHVKGDREFAGQRARGVTVADVDAWLSRLAAGGTLGDDYLGTIGGLVREAFDYWIECGGAVQANRNPVRRKLGLRSERRTWTTRQEQDAMDIIAAVPEDMRGMVSLHSFLGARGYGEVTAIREEDLVYTRLAGESTVAGLARLAAQERAQYDGHRVKLNIQRGLDGSGKPGPLKTRLTKRAVELDHWTVEALARHTAAWPPREGWLFYNPRPAHGPYAHSPADEADLQRRIAARWAEHITPGSVQHGRQAGPSYSSRAIAYIIGAGRPVSTADVAAHLGITPNKASAHLAQSAEAGKLARGGTARKAYWTPGPRAGTPVIGDITVGWSRAQVAEMEGTTKGTVQRILRRLPANPDEPAFSYGTDGKVQPRERWDRPAAPRGDRPGWAIDADLQLWHPWSYRRHLHQAADRAEVTLDEGQVGHLFRHIRISVMAAHNVPAIDIAHHVGVSVQTIESRYMHPVVGAADRALTAIASAREGKRPHLEIVAGLPG